MNDLYHHYGSTRCNGICIQQKSSLFKEDRAAAPIRQYYYEDTVTIHIEQSGSVRTITIIPDNPMRAIYLWGVFHYLDLFFMLCEGRFIEIYDVSFISSDGTNESLEGFGEICVDKRPNFYHSADFCKYHINCWLNPITILSQELFDNWIDLLDKLDIIHNVVLYNVSSVGITIDIKAMFLIESFEGLADLLKHEIDFRKANKGESKLKIYLIAIIQKFGNDIFQKELAYDTEKVTQVFVDSRNRIAHINTKAKRKYFNGEESLVYTIKLFYLYRGVLLHLLGIDYSLFEQELKKAVETWDNHQAIVDRFLGCLL